MTRVKPRYRWYRHCELLAAVLQRVADGEIRRLMVFMPPRHGKSELVSRLFTAYYLYRFPHRWVGINSYGQELANTLSRAAQENFSRGDGQVRADASAVKHWETPDGGGLWAAGVGGPITGKGWHLGVVDDPLKNAEEAKSEVRRAGQQEWYESTFYTREEPNDEGDPNGALIVIQTRWNEQDLSGWLLAQEGDEEPEGWHIVCFEAVKEADEPEFPPTCTVEPDWRQPGEALCPERRPIEKLRRIAKRIGPYYWNALFQQRPRPREGGFFKTGLISSVEAAPADAPRVRYWDKAATEGAGDYTVGLLMARGPDGIFYVEDVVRGQWGPAERDRRMLATAESDRAKYGERVSIWIEQEPGSGGKESALASIQLLAGYAVRSEPVTGDKQVRADPFAAQVEAGNVRLVRGRWNSTAYLRELEAFPNGSHDDQVDTSSGAFNKLTAGNEIEFF